MENPITPQQTAGNKANTELSGALRRFLPMLQKTQNREQELKASAMARLVEQIELSHSLHFSWGYPDYIRQSFKVLQRLQCEFIPVDHKKELTWGQLRKALETADSESARFLVAGSPDTPPNVLDYLSGGPEVGVARRVAEHHNVHVSTLTRLSKHGDASVRMAVSENKRTPEGVLLALTRDPNPDVRYVMAENPAMLRSIIEVLCTDENPYVCDRARATLNRLTKGEVLVADFSRVARRRIGRTSRAAL
jgi:hypothetical protein